MNKNQNSIKLKQANMNIFYLFHNVKIAIFIAFLISFFDRINQCTMNEYMLAMYEYK